MANKPIIMLKIRRILQLHSQGISNRDISQQLGVNRNTVNRYVQRAVDSGRQVDQLQELPDEDLSLLMHQEVAEQLKEHSIKRRYRAIVQGNIKEDEGTVDAPIGRHPIDRKKMAINHKNGKEAVTHYKVLERFGQATYIECRLETGRTHQIRVHMASLGHPLLGDTVYGSSKNPYHLQGQALHAMILGFIHPVTGEYMEFEAPIPEYFSKLLDKLRK